MELFKLMGSILLNDDGAIKTLNDAEKSAKNSAKEMETLGKKAGEMGKKVALGVVAGVAALGGMVMEATKATDRIDKMSQKMGMTSKGFQEWDYILGQNGISIDSLQGGMKTLTNMTDELMKGSKTATDSFGRLGLSMDDLKGKSQEEIFNMTVSALQGVTDSTERAAIANDLLGRSGSELAPLLNAGAGAVDDLRQRAHDLGIVLDDETIKAGVVLGDTMDDVKLSFGTVVTKIGAEVMPIVQKFLDWVLKNMPTIQKVASTVFNGIADAISWFSDNAKWLVPVLAGLLGVIIGFEVVSKIAGLFALLSTITTGATTIFGAFNAVLLANPIGLVALAIGGLIAAGVALWMNWDKIKVFAVGLWDKLKEVFGNIRDFITGVFEGFKNVIKLPTISVTGSLNPATWLKNGLPKLNVAWNAEGGIFTQPTIFDTRNGYQGVGEREPEAIMPLSKLDDMLSNKNNIDYDLLGLAVKDALRGMTIELDRETVGQFVDRRIIKGVY